jgi:diguanylate cyclase with GGDEF domain
VVRVASSRFAPGLVSAGHWRYAVRQVPQAPGWYVVAAARPQSTFGLAAQPTQAALLGLAALMLALALVGFRRSRGAAAQQLAAEQQARVEAEQRSRVDALTGLFNRRHAMETIEHELQRGSAGPGVGILMFDVDHFKRVNDRFGTPAVTPRSWRWPNGSAAASGNGTSSPASAARNSAWWLPAWIPRQQWRRWANGCAWRLPNDRSRYPVAAPYQ